jgi:DNA polymerase III delta prime subunit
MLSSDAEFLWVEKYRPRNIDDTILPEELKNTFKTFVSQKEVPNLLLTGRAGTGKTTIARALLEEIGCDYIVINGSMNGNIDTLRNEIAQFASSISFTGSRKYVILDEADYLNPQSTQPALRNFMEEYSKNCGFILTCNFRNRIIEPIHSRCSIVEFKIPKDEKPKLAMQFYKRLLKILEDENVTSDTKTLAAFVERYFPDFRRTINELQRYSATGSIDSGILSNFQESKFLNLVAFIKDKGFTNVRKWVGEHSDVEDAVLFRTFYDTASEHVKASSIPQLVLLIAKYQYNSAFVADKEINLVAFLTEVMVEIEFK